MKNVYQTDSWKIARENSESKIVEIEKNNEKIIAFERERNIGPFKIKFLFAEGTLEAKNEKEIRGLLNEFKKTSKKYLYGLIAPSVINPSNKIFKKAGFWKIKNYTVLIDLRKSEEEIWQNLEKKSARWGAKFGEKNNLKIELANKNDLKDFYKMYELTTEIGKFKSENYKFIENLTKSDISRLYIVKNGKKIIAGGLILIDKKDNYSILMLTSVSEEGHKLQAMPFLYWNLIKESKILGLDYLDLGGYDLENTSEKMRKINLFKERFGGRVVEQPVYSTNFIYPLIRKIYRIIKITNGVFRIGSK